MKVEQMKRFAILGWGLNSYIMRNARKEYERRRDIKDRLS